MVSKTPAQGASPSARDRLGRCSSVSTFAFTTICFMVWMMFGVIGVPSRRAMLNLNATQFGLLMSMPVLTGSLVRVPLTSGRTKYGGRIVMAAVMAATVPAIWMMGYATEYWHFLTIGLFVGLAGGSFSVAPPFAAGSPRIARARPWGIYGAGNSGRGRQQVCCAGLLVAFGWTMVPRCTPPSCWARWCCSGCSATATRPIWCQQRQVHRPAQGAEGPQGARCCQYYSIVFGGMWPCRCGWCSHVGELVWTSAWPPCWLPASRCPAALRAIGGMLMTSTAHSVTVVMWVSWICLFPAELPQTDFTIATVNGPPRPSTSA